MRIEELRELRDEIRGDMKTDPKLQEAWNDLKAQLPTMAMAAFLLLKAGRARKAGNFTKAIYYAILWLGVTNNANASVLHKELKKKQNSLGYQYSMNFNRN